MLLWLLRMANFANAISSQQSNDVSMIVNHCLKGDGRGAKLGKQGLHTTRCYQAVQTIAWVPSMHCPLSMASSAPHKGHRGPNHRLRSFIFSFSHNVIRLLVLVVVPVQTIINSGSLPELLLQPTSLALTVCLTVYSLINSNVLLLPSALCSSLRAEN